MASTEPPALLPRILAALGRPEHDTGAGSPGALLRTLAASRPGGLMMQLGSGFGPLSAWLVDGMDVTSRFIAVVEDPVLAGHARECMGGDLRITVHSQDTAGFLEDVSRHRFDLVLVDEAGVPGGVLQRLPGMLAAGGMIMLVTRRAGERGAAAADPWPGSDELRLAPGLCGGHVLIASRLQHGMPRNRRGGRRARRAAAGTLPT